MAFLAPLVALIVGIGLLAAGRSSGALVIAPVAAILLVALGAALVNHGLSQQTAVDAALVFAGIPTAIVALVAAVNVWRTRAVAAETQLNRGMREAGPTLPGMVVRFERRYARVEVQ